MKTRRGYYDFPVHLVIFLVLVILMVLISFSSAATVVRTTANVESIAQGDTVLFTMLESSMCTPVTGAPFKYVLGVGLTGDTIHTDSVTMNYGGKDETIKIGECVRKFLKSVNVEKYHFSATYGDAYFTVPSVGYDAGKPKKTETSYISVPAIASGVAEVKLSTNAAERADEACPEEDGAHFCTPQNYCLIQKGSCDVNYLCGGGTCCCSW